LIERIEIKGFESHADTVIEDLSTGLNLVCGESNAGKTSIVRALKLVAYNEFDPKSLRVGCTFCEVAVRTQRGEVRVKRGPKHNLWEITPKGQVTEYYDKPGKDVVPQAAAIIGLNVVELGDVKVPVNIMDQLESHFMLAGIGGKDATGSMRAQVVDEISGLSGIEGIIKEVSLDNHRRGREVKQTEDKIGEVQVQLHDEKALSKEQGILEQAEDLVVKNEECLEVARNGREVETQAQAVQVRCRDLEKNLSAIPDLDRAKVVIKTATAMLSDATRALSLHAKGETALGGVNALKKELAKIPSTKKADLAGVKDRIALHALAADIVEEHTAERIVVEKMEKDLKRLDKDFTKVVRTAQNGLTRLQGVSVLLKEVKGVQGRVEALEGDIKKASQALKKAKAERDEILQEVELCPLTLGPVSKECLEEAK